MSRSKSARFRDMVTATVVAVEIISVIRVLVGPVEGKPFPAPNFQHCVSSEDCCTPAVSTAEITKYEFPTKLPMRIRQAAQSVDNAYIAKYQKAYELMRALPDTDGRSQRNQAKLHCAYCDNAFYFPGHAYPLEIHNNWLFLPWHRLYLYFHERILAKLLGDDTFALPYWNWDNQSKGSPQGNVIPKLYADATGYGPHKNTSFLYDPDRNACSQPPTVVNFGYPPQGCPNKSSDVQRFENAHLLYTQMVSAAVTPSLFFGHPYRYGDFGGMGAGAMEVKPHGPVHIWVNIKDMLEFKNSATDPIFFAHHTNVDRLWTIWKTLPEGNRTDVNDPDWLNTEFTFYDENGMPVSASVGQSLDLDVLRYEYSKAPTPWVTGAVEANAKAPWSLCNLKASAASDLASMILEAKPFRGQLSYSSGPLTFRLKRPQARSVGEEVLEIRSDMDWTKRAYFNAFLYFPTATWDNTSIACPEFIGVWESNPHVGISSNIPGKMVYRVGLRQKLRDIGRENLSHVVITLVGPPDPQQALVLTSAKVRHL